MVFQPPVVLKVMPWGKVELKQKRNKLFGGIRNVTSCIAFAITQCKETPCKAAPGKAAPLGWVANPRTARRSSVYGQTCFFTCLQEETKKVF